MEGGQAINSKIIGIISAIGVLAISYALLKRSTHLYDAERVCHGPVDGGCAEFHMIGNAARPESGILYLGTVTTIGDLPLRWKLRINKKTGGGSKNLDELGFWFFEHKKVSARFGAFITSVKVEDSMATMEVRNPADTLKSIIRLRRLW